MTHPCSGSLSPNQDPTAADFTRWLPLRPDLKWLNEIVRSLKSLRIPFLQGGNDIDFTPGRETRAMWNHTTAAVETNSKVEELPRLIFFLKKITP